MTFDVQQFTAETRERFRVAANPDFVPVPDGDIADESARATAHAEALKRAAVLREAAIRDVAKHAAARLAGVSVGQLWPAGCTEPGYDPAALLAPVQESIAAGDAQSLAGAASRLLIASFLQLLK